MPTFARLFLGRHDEPRPKGHRELQTVQEAEYERQTLQTEVPQHDSPSSIVVSKLEQSPSQRPLERVAHDPAEAYGKTAVRNILAQEGDVDPREFRDTVAELLKEEEYGIFRLVVPSVELGRAEFDEYVTWLNAYQRSDKDEAGQKTKPRRSIYCLPAIPPFSPAALGWTCLMSLVDVTWTAFGVPINVAFCSVNYGQLHSSCTASDLCFGIIYAINLLLSFNLGMIVVNGHRKKVVLDGRRVAWYYMRHGRFILDTAATVPFIYLVVVLILSEGQGYRAKWVNAVSLIRLIRLLRLVTVSKVIYIDSAIGTHQWISGYMRTSTLYVVLVGFQLLVLINLFACVLVLLAYMHGLDNSWMTAVSWTDVPDSSKFYQWYSAMYWVVTTTTTTGFGDFSPRWWAEQVVIGMAMVGGMIAFGILVGSVANALARADISANRFRSHIQKISQVNKWLATCERTVKNETRLQIQEYFAQSFVAKQSVQYGEAELFAELPPYLKFEVARDVALPLVQKVHAFRDLNTDAQQLIAGHLRPMRATVGQQLCRQGDEADRLWLLASGQLVGLRHKETPHSVNAPALVGESLILAMDIPQCRYRPWTIRAALPCQLWELRLLDLSSAIQIYPAIRLSLLDHARKALVRSLFADRGRAQDSHQPSEAQDWCELASLMHQAMQELQKVEPHSVDNLAIILSKASISDGSLQARLSEIVEAAMVRDGLTPEAMLGLPLGVQREAAAQQEQLQRQTTGVASERPSANQMVREGNDGLRGRNLGQLSEGHRGGSAAVPGGGGGGGGGARSSTDDYYMHDTHHGPAPWGMTTEDVLAAGPRAGDPLPPLPPPKRQTRHQKQWMLQKESSKSWHGRVSPQGMSMPLQQQQEGTVASPPAAPLLQHRGLLFGHVTSQKQSQHDFGNMVRRRFGARDGGVQGGSYVDVADGDVIRATDGMTRQSTAPPEMMTSPRLDLPPADSAGTTTTTVTVASPPPSLPPSPRLQEIVDDPISTETGVLSPWARQRLQEPQIQLPLPPKGQLQDEQPPRDTDVQVVAGTEARDAAAGHGNIFVGTTAATAVTTTVGQPAMTATARHQMLGHSGPISLGAVGLTTRRSMLSRMSSPFATITSSAATNNPRGIAAAPVEHPLAASTGGITPSASVTTGATAAPAPTALPSGGGGVGSGSNPIGGDVRHLGARPSGPSGTCTACGSCFCSQCGAWTTPTTTAHTQHSNNRMHSHGQQLLGSLGPIGPGTGTAPVAMSLIDAIRGTRGSGPPAASGTTSVAATSIGSAAGRLWRHSGATWLAAQRNAPPSPRQWAAGGTELDSPTRLLSRRSTMYGRSYAATNRVDSLMRNTLWNAYSREEEELASPSVLQRTGIDD